MANGCFFDDVSVVRDIAGELYPHSELVDIGIAAYSVEDISAIEFFTDGDVFYWNAGGVHLREDVEDYAVVVVEEVVWSEFLDGNFESLMRQHATA